MAKQRKPNAKLIAKQAKIDSNLDYLAEKGISPDVGEAISPSSSMLDYVNNPNFGVDTTKDEETSQFTPEETASLNQEMKLEEAYGDNAGATAAAAGYGALRGLVPGSDLILTKGFGVDPEKIRELKERHEVVSPVAEGAALVGGAVLSGGGTVGAKATVGGGLMAAEKAIGSALAKNVFKNQAQKTIAKQIAEKGILRAMESMPAGAALGINELLNESALGEADLNAENLVAYGGAGAVLNGLVGGAFGAIEASAPLVRSGVNKVTGQFERKFGKVTDFRTNLEDYVGKTASKSAKVADDLAFADDATLKDYVKKWGLSHLDDEAKAFEKHQVAAQGLQKDLNTIYKVVDETAPQGVVNATELKQNLYETVEGFMAKHIDQFDNEANKSMAESLKKEIFNRFERVKGNESAQDVWKLMKTYGENAKNAFKNPAESSLKADIYRELNRATREQLQSNIQRVTLGTPVENILVDLKKLNNLSRVSMALEAPLERKAAGGNSFLNFRDSILAFAGETMLGKGVGFALTAGKKLLESDLKRKMVVLNAIQETQVAAQKRMTSSVANFFEKGKKSVKPVVNAARQLGIMNSGFAVGEKNSKPKNEKEAFKNIQKNVAEYVINPDKLAYKIAASTMKTGAAAPNTSKVAQMTLSKATHFLHDKMPKDSNYNTDILGKKDWEPSNLELSKFRRYVETVENPYHVLDEIEKGTLTREHVETLQQVYPSIYNKLRDTVMEKIGEQPEGVSYNKKVQLGILLDVPTTWSMQPRNILKLQQSFSPTPQQQQQSGGSMVKPTQGGAENITKSDNTKTAMQEAQQGIEE